jgi:glycosyltransferase involved in cell wall biosynthesis
MPTAAYAIITPVRNEGDRIEETIDSVVKQTIRPSRWVLVDDGSADKTGPLIDAAAGKHPWIAAIHRPDRGFRKQGGGVIEAFYDGLKLVEQESWDFLVKLDGDLSFPGDYFENCFKRFAADSRLGIGGGTIYGELNGARVEDSPGDPPFHVRGATKIYRRAAWQAIGGLIAAPGWDTLDEVKANMLGWRTYSFKDLPVLQLKPTGSADGSWQNWVKNGLANYVVGYHPLFMLAKCLRRAAARCSPSVTVGLSWGFLSGYVKRVPRADPDVVRYVRQQQLKCLCFKPSLWS